jgi:hypothetical protein
MSDTDTTKRTNIGPLRFGLRHSKNGIPETYWFRFDETDIERSREILRDTRELKFDVKADSPPDGLELFVHLGKDIEECSEEDALSIRLIRKEVNRWRPRTDWIDRNTRSDVERIKRFHWRAAYARATLCKGPGDPVRLQHGGPVQVKIALGYPDEWYEAMYHEILERLSEDRIEARLTSSFSLFSQALERARDRAEGSSSLELYYRLKRILKEYERALTRILRDPATQVAPQVSYFEIEPEEAAQFYRSRGKQVQVHKAHGVSHLHDNPVPLSFVGSEPVRSLDNEANRFAARSVQKVQSLIQKVGQSLSGYVESQRAANRRFLAQEKGNTTRSPIYRNRERSIKRHEKKAERLLNAKKRFAHYAQKIPVTQTARRTNGISAVMYYDTRYAKLRRFTNLLDFTLRFVDTNESAIPFEVDAFHALYERWCFIQVVEALRDIGFSFERDGEPRTTPFYRHPDPHCCNCTMWSERAPGARMEVWYERRYPKYNSSEPRLYGLETRYQEGRTSYSKVRSDEWSPKVTPDIALEFIDEQSSSQVPEVVTLDPTLGGVHESKYEYRDAIRCFQETEPYSRESRRIVRAAWGIHPGSDEEVDHYYSLDQHDDYSKGFIVLRPTDESTSALPEILDRILCEVGLLESSD